MFTLTGKKILVVDNSKTIRLLIKMMLEKDGIVVVETGSEWGASNKIEEYGVIVDLILMDLVLNHEYGMEIIENIKKTPRYKDIPIIIVTEKAELYPVLKARKLGVKSFLKKPIKKSELIQRIIDALNPSEIAKTSSAADTLIISDTSNTSVPTQVNTESF